MKALRFTVTLAMALVAVACVLNCATDDEIVLPSLPCRDGGSRTEDGQTVFDVPLSKLVGAPSISFGCKGQQVRTTGYLCFTEQFGPILFQSVRAAEREAWLTERSVLWRPGSEFLRLGYEDLMAGLWLLMGSWTNVERYNGYHVTVRGVYKQLTEPAWPTPNVIDDSAPVPAYLGTEPSWLQLSDPLEALKAPSRIPLCSGPARVLPGTIQ